MNSNKYNPRRKNPAKQRTPNKPEGTQQVFNLFEYQQSFDKDAFNALIKGQGVKVTHYRAIPDPTGMASIGDIHAVQSKRQSSDGYLYKEVGKMFATFLGNSSQWQVEVEGLIKSDTAVMTMPMEYIDCKNKAVIIGNNDRFYIDDIEVKVLAAHYVEASSTGVDKLQYPALCVQDLIDADGKDYKQGVHFELTKEGFVKWTSQERPGQNDKTGRGTVYSIVYEYIPYFVVVKLLHEIRVSQITDPMTGDRTLERMPYQVLVSRENVLSDQNKDPNRNMLDMRYQSAPKEGVRGTDEGNEGGMV